MVAKMAEVITDSRLWTIIIALCFGVTALYVKSITDSISDEIVARRTFEVFVSDHYLRKDLYETFLRGYEQQILNDAREIQSLKERVEYLERGKITFPSLNPHR
jgi:hypothetical protein